MNLKSFRVRITNRPILKSIRSSATLSHDTTNQPRAGINSRLSTILSPIFRHNTCAFSNYRLYLLETGIGHGDKYRIYATCLDPPNRFPCPRSCIFLLKFVQSLVLTASLKYGYKISKNWMSPFSFKPRRVFDRSVSTGMTTISPLRKGILSRVCAIPF